MAKLPSTFENTDQLKNMKVGESGYITPWGMWIDMDGNSWLNENYELHDSTGGTVQLKITRVLDGYIAHIHEMNGDYKWTKQNGPSYASPEEVCYGKVVGYDLDYKQVIEVVSAKSKSIWNSIFKWSNN
jgi:hypothetical protein